MINENESLSYSEKETRLLDIKNRHLNEIMSIKGVHGFGLNITDNNFYIAVHEDETLSLVPKEIEGIQVIVEKTEKPQRTSVTSTFDKNWTVWSPKGRKWENQFIDPNASNLMGDFYKEHNGHIVMKIPEKSAYYQGQKPYLDKINPLVGIGSPYMNGIATLGSFWWSNKYNRIAYMTNGHVHSYDWYGQREKSQPQSISISSSYTGTRPDSQIQSLTTTFSDILRYRRSVITNKSDPYYLPASGTNNNTDLTNMKKFGVKRYHRLGIVISSITCWDGTTWNSTIKDGSWVKIEGDNFGMNYTGDCAIWLNDTIKCDLELWTFGCIIFKLPSGYSGSNITITIEAEGTVNFGGNLQGFYFNGNDDSSDYPLIKGGTNVPQVIALGESAETYAPWGYLQQTSVGWWLGSVFPIGEIIDTVPMEYYYPEDPEYVTKGSSAYLPASQCDSSYALVSKEAEPYIEDTIPCGRGAIIPDYLYRNTKPIYNDGQCYIITGILQQDQLKEYLPVVKTGYRTGTTYGYILDCHYTIFFGSDDGIDAMTYTDVIRIYNPASRIGGGGDSGSTVVTTTPQNLYDYLYYNDGYVLSQTVKNNIESAIRDTNGNIVISEGLAVGSFFGMGNSSYEGIADKAYIWTQRFDIIPLAQKLRTFCGELCTTSSFISDFSTALNKDGIISTESCLKSEIYFIPKPTDLTISSTTAWASGTTTTLDLQQTNTIYILDGDLVCEVIPNSNIENISSLIGNEIVNIIPNSIIETVTPSIYEYSNSIIINNIISSTIEIIQPTIESIEYLTDFILSPFTPPTMSNVNFTLVKDNIIVENIGSIIANIIPQSIESVPFDFKGTIIITNIPNSTLETIQNVTLTDFTSTISTIIVPESIIYYVDMIKPQHETLALLIQKHQIFYLELTKIAEEEFEITKNNDITLTL